MSGRFWLSRIGPLDRMSRDQDYVLSQGVPSKMDIRYSVSKIFRIASQTSFPFNELVALVLRECQVKPDDYLTTRKLVEDYLRRSHVLSNGWFQIKDGFVSRRKG